MLMLEKDDVGWRDGFRVAIKRHLHVTLCHKVPQHILDAIAYHW